MNVAIIPARGGGKRIPKKNIRPFAGKPVIAYSIECALESGLFEKVIVSTDSAEIAATATKYGAEAPFVRPGELSDDHATSIAVFSHALRWLGENDRDYDHACLIYATAPFIRVEDLRRGFEEITLTRVSSVFSVTTFPSTVFRAMKIGAAGSLEMIWPQYEMTRSNDLPETYHDAAQFYWVDTRKFLEEERLYTSDALPVVLPRTRVQDIDTQEDWDTAEAMFHTLKMNRS